MTLVSEVRVTRPPPVARAPRHFPAEAGIYALVAVAWIVVVIVTGSPAVDVFRWLAAVAAAVVGPGFVLVRLVRRSCAPLVEDLAWAVPAGCLVALVGWFFDRVLPVSPGAFVFGPVIMAVAVAVPAGRRRVLARPAPGWGWRANAAMAAIVGFSLVWMVTTGLQASPLDPGSGGTAYFPDFLYQLSLVGELHHTLVPTYAPVAGTPLSYHWFLYAIISHLTTGTGVIAFDATLRLSLASMVPAMLLLAAAVARRLSGRVCAGVLAAFLLGVLELSVPDKWGAEFGSVAVITRYWQISPPQSLGWIAGLAALGTICAALRRGAGDGAVPVALTVPFLVLCAGSKSSTLPVLGCGVMLALFVALVRRQWPLVRRCLLLAVIVGAVFETAAHTIYRGSSYGIRVQLWGFPLSRLFMEFPAQNRKHSTAYLAPPLASVLVLIAVCALLLVPLLPRLLGLLYQVRSRPDDPVGWVAGGAAGAGLLAPLVLRHPASSELYFLVSAYPLGVVGSAGGLVLWLERESGRLPRPDGSRRLRSLLLAALAGGAVGAFAVAHLQPRWDPVTRWIRRHPSDPRALHVPTRTLAWQWAQPWVEFAAVAAVLVVAFTLAIRRLTPAQDGPSKVRGWSRPLLVLVSVLLGSGLFGMSTQIYGSDQLTAAQQQRIILPATASESTVRVWRDSEAAGSWIQHHAGSADVVATDLYCRQISTTGGEPVVCDARDFIASAFTQRRTLIGGWAYADRVLATAWTEKVSYTRTPFWDPALFHEQYEAFAHPTRAVLDDLYRTHQVRWLYLDLNDPRVATAAIDRLAIRRFTGAHVGVWQLKTPTASGRSVR